MSKGWGGRRAQQVRAELAATLPAACWRCGGIVTADMAWDVGHLIEVDLDPSNAYDPDAYAVEHAYCNRRAGAQYGNRKRAGWRRRPTTSRRWTSRDW